MKNKIANLLISISILLIIILFSIISYGYYTYEQVHTLQTLPIEFNLLYGIPLLIISVPLLLIGTLLKQWNTKFKITITFETLLFVSIYLLVLFTSNLSTLIPLYLLLISLVSYTIYTKHLSH